MRLTDHHVAGTKRQLKPNTSPYYLTVKAEIKQLRDIHMTCGRTWTPGSRTAYGLHPSYVATWPDIEAPCTPFASLTR